MKAGGVGFNALTICSFCQFIKMISSSIRNQKFGVFCEIEHIFIMHTDLEINLEGYSINGKF